MSWLFSQALVAAFSEENSWDGEQSAPLKSNPTPQAYLSSDRMTGYSRLSRFGMTFAHSTESLGEELLTWFLAGFPARTSALQEKALESQASGQDAGQNLPGLLAKYDPDTHSLKTAQCSLFEDLTESSPTLPRWGTMRNGAVYQRPTVATTTSATEYGFSPTVTANQSLHCSIVAARNEAKRLHPRGQWTLWTLISVMESGSSGYLNPAYAEWLMIFPEGWTALKPLETDKYQSWLRQHFNYCESESDAKGQHKKLG